VKLWIDDVRPAPEGYAWCKSVIEAKLAITNSEALSRYSPDYFDDEKIELIDIDHDAGKYVGHGGDYIRLLDWLEETGRNYPIRIHSANPVGVANMRRIIERNSWKEIR
jgi:hypothetical protein